MRFVIQPELFDVFPGICIAVAVASGLDNASAKPLIDAGWRAAWADAAQLASQGNAQSQPRIRPWRERFRALGISGKDFPCSAEALLRRAMKGGEPFSINPLVDFYNTLSLRHLVPAGAFDLDQLEGDLELRFTRAGDTFWVMDADTPIEVPPGEVAYADAREIITRHFVWRQARTGLIQPETRNVILVSEILGDVGREVAEAILTDFADGLRRHYAVELRCLAIADVQLPAVSW